MLDQNTLTVCKQMGSNNSFKSKLTYKLFIYKSSIYICVCVCVCVKQDLALNNPRGLSCHKKPTNHPLTKIQRDCGCLMIVLYRGKLSTPFTLGGVVVPIRAPSIGHIDLFSLVFLFCFINLPMLFNAKSILVE